MTDNDLKDLELYDKEKTIELRKQYIGPSCTVFFQNDPLKIVKGRGQYMFDERGNKYLDCINNVAHVGHCHPTVVEAGSKQMATISTNSRYLHDEIVRYAQRLVKTFPEKLSVCFFVNSGSEANDLALNLARYYTKATDYICIDNAYHGHVISVDAVSPFKFDKPGAIKPADTTHVAPCADVYRGKYMDKDYPGEDMGKKYADDLKEIIDNVHNKGRNVAGFIIESLQSCGGQIIYPPGYLRQVFKYVREAGGLCIADEVQVGFGRVGDHMWAFEVHGEDVVPDIVTVGKPIGNGHPISAVVTTPEIAASFAKKGTYFNTFGGNPVSCAIANAVMDVIEKEDLLKKAKTVGQYMMDQFKELSISHQIIGDVRGVGLFIGVDLVRNRETREPATEEAQYLLNRARKQYVILSSEGPYENIIKIKPPMVFDESNVDRLIEVFRDILVEIENGQVDFHKKQLNGS